MTETKKTHIWYFFGVVRPKKGNKSILAQKTGQNRKYVFFAHKLEKNFFLPQILYSYIYIKKLEAFLVFLWVG